VTTSASRRVTASMSLTLDGRYSGPGRAGRGRHGLRPRPLAAAVNFTASPGTGAL
jgi:hypothetical protein